MKLEKFKETIFVIGVYTFLLMFFYSFIETKWSNETLNYLKSYIGALGLVLVVVYIERPQTVLSKKNYLLIKIFAIIFSLLLKMVLTS